MSGCASHMGYNGNGAALSCVVTSGCSLLSPGHLYSALEVGPVLVMEGSAE